MIDHYRPKTYRLSDKTIDNLAKLADEEKLTFNMLLSKLIKRYANKSLRKMPRK